MKLTISVLQFCSRLPSSLWKLRQHVCAMCPLCEETFPTSIPREAGKGAAINNSRARWTQVPSFSSWSYMGLIDTAIIPPERRWLFWTRLAKCTIAPLQKKQVCILDAIEPLRAGAVQCWCSLLQSKMKETNKISQSSHHGHTEMEISSKSSVWSKSLFLLFPQILFEKLLTDADDASVQPKRRLKALFWCFIQTYFCLWSVW